MKEIFLLLFVGGFVTFTACNEKVKVASATDKDSIGKMNVNETKGQEHKQIVSSMIEALNKHDAVAMFKFYAPNYLDYGDGSSKPMALDSTRSAYEEWFHTFPDFKADNLKYLVSDDWLVVWGDWSGTWKGDFMKQKATGKSFKVVDADFYRFNDEGKIVEHHNVQPFSSIWTQIGLKM